VSRVAALVTAIGEATPYGFSNNEPRSLAELGGFYFTLTPDLMRPDLWSWKGAPEVPVLVAASACWDGRQLRAYTWPAPAPIRFCDSGGFVFGRKAGGFPFSLDDYHDWLTLMRPDVAACLDLPCEAEIATDDAEVARRQRWTLEAAAELLHRPATWRWLPVVQGRTLEQYAEHARAYRAAGLVTEYMGIGSLCRRTSLKEIRAIIGTVGAELPAVRFHLFGVALRLLAQRAGLHPAVLSLDSGAWNGRFGSDIPAFNAEMQANQWSQREAAIHWALPRYAAKVAAALAGTKQQTWC
jgi:hypothetical protein